jgi:hypothetical protein
LADQQPQLGDISSGRLHLHFKNFKRHAAGHVQEEMASHGCVRVPHPRYSPDLAFASFNLLGPLRQQLSERTLGSELTVLEHVTEALTGLPKDEVKTMVLH